MTPIFFKDQKEFRKWLEKNHKTKTELLVGFCKVTSGRLNMTWSESVDEALCFGWIDGIRKSIDRETYCIRFTPRKPTSTWSAINIRKVEELQKKGMMTPSGLEAFNNRKKTKSGIYSFENSPAILSEAFEEKFKANKSAWDFFVRQAPSYKRTIMHWIISAKQEATRLSRLDKAILTSEAQKKIF